MSRDRWFFGFGTYFCVFTIACSWGSWAVAGENLLIRARINGKESSIYEKVVVVSDKATLAPSPGKEGDLIEPFAIFFRLKDEGISGAQDYVRVGTSSGEPLGWIKRLDAKGGDMVTSWNTRFILEPLPFGQGRPRFSVVLDSGNRADLKDLDAVAEGQRRFALVMDAPKDEESPFPVIVYASRVQTQGTGGTLAGERKRLQDLKLEVVFVLETTGYLLCTFDDFNVGDSVKGVIREVSAAIRANKDLQGAIRLGLVEYQDTTKDAKFVSRVACALTDQPSEFDARVDMIAPVEIHGDWPEDVIAGLDTAVRQAGWSENSSKHIILLGASSCQLYPQGQHVNQFGGNWNLMTEKLCTDYGWNSTGLSISQLIARANPEGGSSADTVRQARTFHTVLVGRELGEVDEETKKAIKEIVRYPTDKLDQLLERGMKFDTLKAVFLYYLWHYQRDLATVQYREISLNRLFHGLNLVVRPSAEDIRTAAAQIKEMLTNSFSTLADIRSGQLRGEKGKEELRTGANAVTQTFYEIVGADADKFRRYPVLRGTAGVRDEKGRQVAQKKILVSRDELTRLRSTLDALHKKFQARTSKADRQDVSVILNDLKQVTASTTAGQQKFAAGVRLKDIISDLPLRTTALETTPGDLAVMPSDTFKQWLNKLESAIFRADELLSGKAEWLELNSKAQNDKFTFLHVAELP